MYDWGVADRSNSNGLQVLVQWQGWSIEDHVAYGYNIYLIECHQLEDTRMSPFF